MSGGICLCGRAPRGFGWQDFTLPAFQRPPRIECCSMQCLDIAAKREGDMQLNIEERKAVEAASANVGGYLESIGKTDLAEMTEGEWLGFLAHAYTEICAEVRSLWSEAPF